LVGLCVGLIGLASLAGWLILRAKEPPVYTISQAYLLGCSDAGAPGDACHPHRVAGNVVGNSVRWDRDFGAFQLMLTDGCWDKTIYFHGDAATARNLHARDFVVAEGETSIDGEFHSTRLFVGAEAGRLSQEIPPEEVGVPHVDCLHEQPARNAH